MTTLVPNAEFARLASVEQIATTVAARTARGMAAEVVESGAEARSRVLDLLPEGASVFTSMSRTLDTLGLSGAINDSSRYHPLRPQLKTLDREKQEREWRRLLSSPEYVVGSVHAVTEQGQVLIASASGSQLASYVFGADHVIWVVGVQKIVRSLDEGFRRVREYSYPLEHERIQALGGVGSHISKILLVEGERPGRISVILVKEVLGF
jgi:L-lactate utilization protein LutC